MKRLAGAIFNNMIGIIIQARMGSSRLPGKVLKPIAGKPLISYIMNRLTQLKTQTRIILATTDSPLDNIISNYCEEHLFECFRGNEDNVLERFYLCATRNHLSHIVRLTADNPFTDIEELDNLIVLHQQVQADYSYSYNSLPKGVGAEIFTYEALKESYLNATEANHMEHVNEYILENPSKFKIITLNVSHEKNKPEISLTIDTPQDYKKICQLLSQGHNDFMTTEKAIELCSQLP